MASEEAIYEKKDNNDKLTGNLSKGAIIGIIIGVIIATIAFFCICYCINLSIKAKQRRERKKRSLPYLGAVPHDYKSLEEEEEEEEEDAKEDKVDETPTTVKGHVVKAVQAVTGTAPVKSSPPKQTTTPNLSTSETELVKPVKSNDDELRKNPKVFQPEGTADKPDKSPLKSKEKT